MRRLLSMCCQKYLRCWLQGAAYSSLSPTVRSLHSVIASVTYPTLCTSLRFTTWLRGFLWTGRVLSTLLPWHWFIFLLHMQSALWDIVWVLLVCGSVFHCGTLQIDSRSQRTKEPVLFILVFCLFFKSMLCFQYTFTFITVPIPAYFAWKTLPQVIFGASLKI